VAADVAQVFLTANPLTVASRKGKLRGFEVHPSDLYLLSRSVSIA